METLNRGIACKQDEAAPLVSEEMYRAVVESSPDAMLILDDQFRIIFVNETVCRVSGFSREDYLQRNFMDFLSEENKALVVERYRKRQQGENPPSKYDISYLMKNGESRHAELKTSIDALIADDAVAELQFEVFELSSLPDEVMVAAGGMFRGDLGCNGTILYGPEARVRGFPSGQGLPVKEGFESRFIRKRRQGIGFDGRRSGLCFLGYRTRAKEQQQT